MSGALDRSRPAVDARQACRSLRIAMLHATLPSPERGKEGGVTYQVHELANRLAQRGHQVTVFALDAPPGGAKYAVQRVHLPQRLARSRIGRYYGVPMLYRRQHFDTFDIVHTHGDDWLLGHHSPPVLRSFYGTALQEARTSTTVLRRANHLALYGTEIISALRASACVGISRDTQRWLPRIRGVIPCGVDLRAFRPGQAKGEVPAILFVGALRGRKRGLLLVQQFAQFVLPVLPAAELWLVGDEPVQAPGVRSFGKVTQDELIDLYQRTWLFCLPSSFEGFGVPYIESMACGTAVVATPNPGAREITRDGSVGVLAEPCNLGATLVGLLRDGGRRDALVAASLLEVKRYSWDSVVRDYEDEYRRLLAESVSTGQTAGVAKGG